MSGVTWVMTTGTPSPPTWGENPAEMAEGLHEESRADLNSGPG